MNKIDRVYHHMFEQEFKKRVELSRKSPFKNWKEIDLKEFVQGSYRSEKDYKWINLGGHEMTVKTTPDGTAQSIEKSNLVTKTIEEYYNQNKESAERNELFLNLEGDRAYGFCLLNVHTADMDIAMGNNPAKNHLMIRYNENTIRGWKERMDYITQIFKGMGFDVDKQDGYLHMNHETAKTPKDMQPVLKEALRGLVSTTHLNITFGDFPDKVSEAVHAFQEGTTNVYKFIEALPDVKKRKAEMMDEYYNLYGPYGNNTDGLTGGSW